MGHIRFGGEARSHYRLCGRINQREIHHNGADSGGLRHGFEGNCYSGGGPSCPITSNREQHKDRCGERPDSKTSAMRGAEPLFRAR